MDVDTFLAIFIILFPFIFAIFFLSYMFYMQYKINNAWREYSRLIKLYNNMKYNDPQHNKIHNEVIAMHQYCLKITPPAYLSKYRDKYE